MTSPGAELEPPTSPPSQPALPPGRAPIGDPLRNGDHRPAHKPAPHGAGQRSTRARPARRVQGQRIVIVDDEPDIVAILAEALRTEGYVAEAFTHPVRAFEHITRSPPALLLTDLYMPYLSGAELVNQVHAAVTAMPIIIMSASANIRNIARLPAQGFLGKPFDLDELSELVAKLLHV